MAFVLKSSAFQPGGSVGRQYTCDGEDLSPPLAWEDPPRGTAGYALICDDPDAPMGTWVHWVIYNIPARLKQLPEGVPAREKLPDGTLQGINDFGRVGYGGPCPPPGKPHRYFFRLYALDRLAASSARMRKSDLLKAMSGRVLGETELMGKYGRR